MEIMRLSALSTLEGMFPDASKKILKSLINDTIISVDLLDQEQLVVRCVETLLSMDTIPQENKYPDVSETVVIKDNEDGDEPTIVKSPEEDGYKHFPNSYMTQDSPSSLLKSQKFGVKSEQAVVKTPTLVFKPEQTLNNNDLLSNFLLNTDCLLKKSEILIDELSKTQTNTSKNNNILPEQFLNTSNNLENVQANGFGNNMIIGTTGSSNKITTESCVSSDCSDNNDTSYRHQLKRPLVGYEVNSPKFARSDIFSAASSSEVVPSFIPDTRYCLSPNLFPSCQFRKISGASSSISRHPDALYRSDNSTSDFVGAGSVSFVSKFGDTVKQKKFQNKSRDENNILVTPPRKTFGPDFLSKNTTGFNGASAFSRSADRVKYKSPSYHSQTNTSGDKNAVLVTPPKKTLGPDSLPKNANFTTGFNGASAFSRSADRVKYKSPSYHSQTNTSGDKNAVLVTPPRKTLGPDSLPKNANFTTGFNDASAFSRSADRVKYKSPSYHSQTNTSGDKNAVLETPPRKTLGPDSLPKNANFTTGFNGASAFSRSADRVKYKSQSYHSQTNTSGDKNAVLKTPPRNIFGPDSGLIGASAVSKSADRVNHKSLQKVRFNDESASTYHHPTTGHHVGGYNHVHVSEFGSTNWMLSGRKVASLNGQMVSIKEVDANNMIDLTETSNSPSFQDLYGIVPANPLPNLQTNFLYCQNMMNLEQANKIVPSMVEPMVQKPISEEPMVREPTSQKPMVHEPTSNNQLPGTTVVPVVAPVEELPSIDVQMVEVMNLIPDIEVNYLREKLAGFQGGDNASTVQRIINYLLENPYPKQTKENKTTMHDEREIDYFVDFSLYPSHTYCQQVLSLMQAKHFKLSTQFLRDILSIYNHHYAPTEKAIQEILEKNKEITKCMLQPGEHYKGVVSVNIAGKMTRNLSIKTLLCGRKNYRPPANIIPELQEEIDFYNRQIQKDIESTDRELAVTLNGQEYEQEGQLIECGCCYGEVAFEQMVQCSDGHLFCTMCMNSYAKEAVYGSGKLNLSCMSDGCESRFPKSQLDKCLPKDVIAKYEERQKEESLNLADLDNLVKCPSCEFAAIMDTDDKVFKCQNPDCLKESCRYCKENWKEHIGVPCSEIEKKDETSLRVSYEERMTNAKMRTCFKCKTGYMKSDGCNKITCRCGAKMCYICRLPNIDYNHFCQHPRTPGHTCAKCQACSLWSDPKEDDERAVKEIEKKLQEERKAKGYDARDDKKGKAPARSTP
ncbi:uncharacterized protein [Antedon mediterranea]|uniref:uncharacterized protein n=1 Tax=Antedon mediterranea TaxID=105859 RepID=UPI003AF4E36A